nr:sigma-70 family RNA polymerase sigma factor [Candidatus Moranbacteria bacterium]
MLNDTASKNEKSRSEVTEEKKEKRNREGIIDNELVRMVKEENQEKYAEIIERYRGKLFAYLYRLIGEKEEAEDLLQDVFIKAYRNLSSYDANRRFSSWIYRIAHNEAVNHIKKKSLRKFIPIDNIVSTKDKLNFSSNEEDAQTSWIRKETNKELDDAIPLFKADVEAFG